MNYVIFKRHPRGLFHESNHDKYLSPIARIFVEDSGALLKGWVVNTESFDFTSGNSFFLSTEEDSGDVKFRR